MRSPFGVAVQRDLSDAHGAINGIFVHSLFLLGNNE
jgi:hypothetical protein